MSSPTAAHRRSPARRSTASPHSMRSRATFVAKGLNGGVTYAKPELDRSSPISSHGCARSSASLGRVFS